MSGDEGEGSLRIPGEEEANFNKLSEQFLTNIPALGQLPHTGEILQYKLGLLAALLEPTLGLHVSLHEVAQHHRLSWVS